MSFLKALAAYPAESNPFSIAPVAASAVAVAAAPLIFLSAAQPAWTIELSAWFEYAGVAGTTPETAARFSRLGKRWHILPPEAWHRLDYAFRAVALRDALRGDVPVDARRHAIRTIEMLARAEAGRPAGEGEWIALHKATTAAREAATVARAARTVAARARSDAAAFAATVGVQDKPAANAAAESARAADAVAFDLVATRGIAARMLRTAVATGSSAVAAAHSAAWAAAWRGKAARGVLCTEPLATARKAANSVRAIAAQAAAHRSAARMALEMVGLLEAAVIDAELADIF